MISTIQGTNLYFAELTGILPDLNAAAGGCFAIQRSDTGRLIRSDVCALNYGSFDTSGLDFKLNMSWDLGNAGLLALRHQTNYVLDFNNADYISGPLVDQTDRRGVPQFRSNFDINWSYGDHLVALSSYYIPSQWRTSQPNPNLDLNNPDSYYNVPTGGKIDNYWHHNLAYTYSAPWNAAIQVGVTNLLDEDPVIDINNVTDDTLYPFKARTYYIQYTHNF